MLNTRTVAFLVATALGFLAGLGVGGGSLLVLWLTLILDLPYPQARIYNLLFFIPSAVIASVFRWKSGTRQLKKIIPGILAGCIGAVFASTLGQSTDIDVLKKMFGILLLVTGIRELMYKPAKNKKEG